MLEKYGSVSSRVVRGRSKSAHVFARFDVARGKETAQVASRVEVPLENHRVLVINVIFALSTTLRSDDNQPFLADVSQIGFRPERQQTERHALSLLLAEE